MALKDGMDATPVEAKNATSSCCLVTIPTSLMAVIFRIVHGNPSRILSLARPANIALLAP